MTTDLAVKDEVLEHAAVTLFRTDQPGEVVARATETANVLAGVIRAQKLAVKISGREHVRVEGWTLLGTMLGVFPVCLWSRKFDGGWEARVEARTLAGNVVGAAEAECLRTEKTWANRDDYALRSMAQTRATSKALRQPLGFVMTLAGFDPTPVEEMPVEIEDAETKEVNPTGELESQFYLLAVALGGEHEAMLELCRQHRGDVAWFEEQIAKGQRAMDAKAAKEAEQEAFPIPDAAKGQTS